MKLDKPIGDATYGPLFIRAGLGTYLIMSGLLKLDNPQGLIEQVKLTQIFSDKWATVYAILLPYLEVFFGALFISGFWTTFASFAVALIIGSFIYTFGVKFTTPGPFNTVSPFNRDLVSLAPAPSPLFTR